jgi:sulfite exporter TauE/SafE
VGFVPTVAGPDHYIPFLAMSRAGRWSAGKTLFVTVCCGVGHVLGSIVLGALGVALGWNLTRLEWLEGVRGSAAGWCLLGFGLAYLAWGIRRSMRGRRHSHLHTHSDGVTHAHEHDHHHEHAHVHRSPALNRVTPWALFTIFVFGPCEPLVPLLMYPAAAHSVKAVALVAGVFALTTIGTMTAIVMAGRRGLSAARFGLIERHSHVLAGLAITLCGAAIQLGL